MYGLLFVTDDPTQKKPLKSALLEGGFRVSLAASGDLFKQGFSPDKQVDIVLVDLERLKTEASKVCHTLKRERSLADVPLVLLVAEDNLGRMDFGWGIEDYLTLPVSPKRLTERLKFLMWKRHRVETKNQFIQGELAINFDRYEVHVKGVPVDLTYKEFELLKFLALNPGRVFTREALLDKVWGYDYYGGTRTVDVHVRRLRSKIELHGSTYVETVRNVGYRFLSSE